MPTLYHAPDSRSETILTLVKMLKADDIDIVEVTIPRQDGSGGPDPKNPHPEKKVPFLVDGDEQIRERGAIIVWLTDRYSQTGLGPQPGAQRRGEYLSWLFYYQGVMEPLVILQWAGVTHPVIADTYRDMVTVEQRLAEALSKRPFLLGEEFSAADLLCSSFYFWFRDLIPDNAVIRAWVDRCGERVAAAGR